jgi:Ca2+-binding RTX toxin-like protein
MATVDAYDAFDLLAFDLNWYLRNLDDSTFENNIFLSYEGTVYEDLIMVEGSDAGGAFGLILLGSGFVFGASGNLIAGQVKVLAEYIVGGDDIWVLGGVNLSAAALNSAAITVNTSDDFALIASGLTRADDIDLSDGNDRFGGFAGNDLIVGRAGDDALYGGSGNDEVYGDDGDDELYGEVGDDDLEGGPGADALWGGDGIDYALYTEAAASVTASLLVPGANTGVAAGDTYFNIEGLVGSAFDDVLFGDATDNDLYGSDGHDELGGLGGADYLDGEGGNDTLDGGGGDDTLLGGAGDDVMTGGAGADWFVYRLGDGKMAIKDFEPGLDDLVFDGLGPSFTVASLLPYVSQQGEDVVIAAGTQEVRFENTLLSELSVGDVVFI